MAAYLQRRGYRIVPVNPRETEVLGERAYPSLRDIPDDIDIDVVDVFRRAEETPEVARDAVAIGAKVLWLQDGIVSDEAYRIATEGGAAALGSGGGLVEEGRTADLVLLDVSGPHCQPIHDLHATLVYAVRASDVVTVLVGGEVVVRDRTLQTADLQEIVQQAARIAPSLTRTDGEAVQHYAP